jgi:hypothetical protein
MSVVGTPSVCSCYVGALEMASRWSESVGAATRCDTAAASVDRGWRYCAHCAPPRFGSDGADDNNAVANDDLDDRGNDVDHIVPNHYNTSYDQPRPDHDSGPGDRREQLG